MNFARLLTAGKSLVGLGEAGPRYRVNKNVRLPKFGAAKNPFNRTEEKHVSHETHKMPLAEATKPAEVERSGPKLETIAQAKRRALATTKLDQSVKRIRELGSVMGARTVAVMADWARKVSPIVPRKQPRAAARSAAAEPAPLQGELSLDRVKVVRNDLSDTDFELRQPSKPSAMPKTAAAVVEKLEPVGAAWNRLTTRFFGDDQT
jgi:hypothetical protein